MRGLAPWSWIGAPLVLAFLVTWLLSTPVRLWGLRLPEPILPMLLAFAWPVIRPSILAPFGLLLVGLFMDLLWGTRTGLWPMGLLTAYGFVLATRSMMAGQNRLMMIVWYAATIAVGMGVVYICTMGFAGGAANPLSMAWQFLATLILYPFADRLIDRFEDADVRFR